MSRTRRLLAAATLATAVVLPVAVFTGGAAQASSNAEVSVFHGIPGVPVDVFVDGKKTLTNFQAGTIAGPLSLPAGTYKIEIKTYPSDATTVYSGSQAVEGGMNYTIAAYLNTSGKPAVKAFVNDTKTTMAGQGRVTVRHLADAPTVAITADGKTLVASLSNGNEAVADVPAATYKVGIVAGGTTVKTASVMVKDGVNTIVYAYGTYPSTFALAVQNISGLASMPNSVPAGNAGLANDGTSVPFWVLGLSVAGIAGAAFAGRRLVTARNEG